MFIMYIEEEKVMFFKVFLLTAYLRKFCFVLNKF